MKKLLAVTATSLLGLSLLAGCGFSKPAANQTAPKKEASKETAASGAKMVLSLGHATSNSANSHYQQGAEKFKELIEKATNGEVSVKIYPNAELGGEREMIEAVQLGTLDMVLTSSGPLGNFASKSNAFDFPFLFKNREHAYKVLDGEIGNEVNKQLEEKGIKNLAWMENGFRNITNSKRPIKKPEDLKGIKIRTMENKVHMEAFKQYGADPTPMSFAELFTALQQKVVDAQENPLSVIVPNKFYEAQKYLTLSNHVYSPAPLLMNKKKFDSLSPDLQKKFLEAAAGARDYEREFVNQKNEEYLKTAKEKGMEIVTEKEFDYDAFVNASKPVYDKLGKEYADILKRIEALK